MSPYHGSRCEDENTVSVQIAVGSSVMAAVLIVFLAIIICKCRDSSLLSCNEAHSSLLCFLTQFCGSWLTGVAHESILWFMAYLCGS